MLKVYFIVFGCGILLYLLYIGGFVVYQKKRALKFIGRNRCKEASFSSCHGEIRRVIHVKETGTYTFVLDDRLTEGMLDVNLYTREKKDVFTLNKDHKKATVQLEKGKRYYLRFIFFHATGEYRLDWE